MRCSGSAAAAAQRNVPFFYCICRLWWLHTVIGMEFRLFPAGLSLAHMLGICRLIMLTCTACAADCGLGQPGCVAECCTQEICVPIQMSQPQCKASRLSDKGLQRGLQQG